MVGRDSFFYGDPGDNGFNSQESDLEQGHYNGAYRPSTMGPPYPYPYPFPKPEIYTPIVKTVKTLPLDPRKTANTKTRGPSINHRRDRERALSKLPAETLVERLINEENRSREARNLLKTAISHLEAATQRANRAEEARKVIEEERRTMETNQTMHGLKVTQGIMNAQKETAKAQEEVGLYKLQLQHAEREVQRAHTVVRTVEDERDSALNAAKKAKEFARQMNEEKLMVIAREEGRKEGFEEGMRQGRLLAITGDETVPRRHISDRAHATPVGSGAAFIEEYNEDEDKNLFDGMQEDEHPPPNDFNRPPDMTRSMHHRPRQHRTPHTRHASLDSTPRGRSNAPRSVPAQSQPQTPQRPASTVPASNASAADETVRLELEAARRETAEAQSREAEAQRREAEQREEIRQWHERHEKAEREKEQKALLEREQAREAELKREREAIRAKDAERDREVEAIRQREKDMEAERAREREELQKEREERQRERERDREREEARQKELAAAKSATATRPAMNLPYLPMPPPPGRGAVQAPSAPPAAQAPVVPPPSGRPQSRPQPQQFQPSHRRRRSSPETRSPSSSTTGISQFDIVTFPTSGVNRREDRDRDRDLSDIPEVPSIRSQSRASEAQPTPPSWVNNPPVDYTMRGGIDEWRHSSSSHSPSDTPTALSPLRNDYLSPTFQPRGRGAERIPAYDYRRASSGSSNSYNFVIQPPSRPASRPEEPDIERHGFLSPNHAPRALAPEPPVVIAPTEIFAVPPPGFVAYTSPSNGHANLGRNGGGGGGGPPSSNIYSRWGAPGSPNTPTAPLSAQGVPPPPSISGMRYSDTPPAHGHFPHHAPRPSPIYAPTPPAHSQPLRGSDRPVIPPPFYAPTPPAHSQPLRGSDRPVIPPPFSQMAPRQPGSGGATPGPYTRSLPGGPAASTPRGGMLRRVPSDDSLSSSGSYSRPRPGPGQGFYANPGPYDGSESPPDPATQRNTLANAASAAGALPIPPPSFSRQRY